MQIPVVVQHRHAHLSQADTQTLFGVTELDVCRRIDQRNQFVGLGSVQVHGPKGSFPDVCVIAPSRSRTQIELSSSDAFSLGLKAPLRISGDLDRSATVVLKTQKGEVKATASTIIPIRHLHLPPHSAQELGVAHQDIVQVTGVEDTRVVFAHVMVRVHPTFSPAFHLTKDEAAPYWIQTGDHVTL
jgi:putative phosphotransacetylase